MSFKFVAVLWPPFYNSVEPSWAGIPFFYWYQMLWVIIGAVLTAIVYFATEAERLRGGAKPARWRGPIGKKSEELGGGMPWRT